MSKKAMSRKRATKIAARLSFQAAPYNLRVAHTLKRIFTAAGRDKTAFSASDIDRVVQHALRKDRVPQNLALKGLEIPDVNWGDIFHRAINSLASRRGWADQQREDFLNDVVGDLVMGQTIMGIRDTEEWKHNLATQIEEWVSAGWDKRHIEATLTRWIQHKAANIYKRWKAVERPEDVGFNPGAPEDDGSSRSRKEIFENLMDVEGLESSQMATYHSIIRDNPDAKQIVNQIGDMLHQRYDALGLIWQAYTNDPSASIRDLLVTNVTDEGGRKMPLWEALGYEENGSSNVGKLHHQIKKLRDTLMTAWPEIEEVLNEIV